MCGDLRPWRSSLCPWRCGDPFGPQSSACPKSPQKDACTLRCVFLYFFLARGHGSVGRAPPCQGGGRGFEPRCPLHAFFGPVLTGPSHMATWPSGKAWACKAPTPSSNLGVASSALHAAPGLRGRFCLALAMVPSLTLGSRPSIYAQVVTRGDLLVSVCLVGCLRVSEGGSSGPWSLPIVPRRGSCRDYERVRAANDEDLAVARRKMEGKSPLVTSNGKTDANPGRG